jgi:hypothetical protein
MNLVDPKLYAVLRRQCPELPAVHKPNRAGEPSSCSSAFVCLLLLEQMLFRIRLFAFARTNALPHSSVCFCSNKCSSAFVCLLLLEQNQT